MPFIFIDKTNFREATPSEDGNGFYIGSDGNVYEFIVQDYASHRDIVMRDDLTWCFPSGTGVLTYTKEA